MTDLDLSLADFVTHLKESKPSEIAKRCELHSIRSTKGGLYPHQELARRGSVNQKNVILMHHAGLGKTTIMISIVEGSRFSHGANRKVHVITKDSIKNDTIVDIKKYHKRLGTDLDETKILKYYQFYTYSTFKKLQIFTAPNTGNPSKDHADYINNIVRYFGDSYVVIDEFHNVGSYSANDADSMSIFKILCLLRRNVPTLKMIAMTFTPMLNSVAELSYMTELFLGAENDEKKTVGEEVAVLVEKFDISKYIREARRLVDNVALFYQKSPKVITPFRIGTKFTLDRDIPETRINIVDIVHLESLSQLTGMLTKDIKPNEYVYSFLEMTNKQSEEYVANFSGGANFFISDRTRALCGSTQHIDDSLPDALYEYGKISILLAFWIQIETITIDHFGTSAWFFNDMVSVGAATFAKMLEHNGWKQWNIEERYSRSSPKWVPRYIMITGDNLPYRREILEDLNSNANYDGSLIRTIIYTKAARDGINIQHSLRGGSLTSWTKAGQDQADNRRFRINSLDRLNDEMHEPAFREAHKYYIFDGVLSPLVFDCITMPAHDYSFLPEAAGSVDYHMMRLRENKNNEISQVYSILTEGSVDERVRLQHTTTAGNYYSRFMLEDLQESYSTSHFTHKSYLETADVVLQREIGELFCHVVDGICCRVCKRVFKDEDVHKLKDHTHEKPHVYANTESLKHVHRKPILIKNIGNSRIPLDIKMLYASEYFSRTNNRLAIIPYEGTGSHLWSNGYSEYTVGPEKECLKHIDVSLINRINPMSLYFTISNETREIVIRVITTVCLNTMGHDMSCTDALESGSVTKNELIVCAMYAKCWAFIRNKKKTYGYTINIPELGASEPKYLDNYTKNWSGSSCVFMDDIEKKEKFEVIQNPNDPFSFLKFRRTIDSRSPVMVAFFDGKKYTYDDKATESDSKRNSGRGKKTRAVTVSWKTQELNHADNIRAAMEINDTKVIDSVVGGYVNFKTNYFRMVNIPVDTDRKLAPYAPLTQRPLEPDSSFDPNKYLNWAIETISQKITHSWSV